MRVDLSFQILPPWVEFPVLAGEFPVHSLGVRCIVEKNSLFRCVGNLGCKPLKLLVESTPRITELFQNSQNSLLTSLLSGNLEMRRVRSGLRRQPPRPVSVTHVPRVGEPAVFPGFRAG